MEAATAAAIIVGLHQVGRPIVDVVSQFLAKVLAPSGDALGAALAHPIVEWQRRRVERAARLVAEAARMVQESGRGPQPVPGRLLMPILERGSLEEEEVLRLRWVALLAHAASSPEEVLPSFADILSELSPLEVRMLDKLHQLRAEKDYDMVEDGPASRFFFYARLFRMSDWTFLHQLMAEVGSVSPQQTAVHLTNLERLSLIQANQKIERLPPEAKFYEGHLQSVTLEITAFGDAFVTACSGLPPAA